jgi:hypothetical protein
MRFEAAIEVRDPVDLKRRLTESVESGSELRLIDCTSVDRERLVVGMRSIAAIREGKVEYVVFQIIED